MTQAARSVEPQDEIYTFVASTIAQELKLEEMQLSPTLNLRSVAGIESIKMLRIICKVEQKYDIELEDDVVFQVNTIQDIVSAIENATAGSGTEP
jgi:acyl carrier protein